MNLHNGESLNFPPFLVFLIHLPKHFFYILAVYYLDSQFCFADLKKKFHEIIFRNYFLKLIFKFILGRGTKSFLKSKFNLFLKFKSGGKIRNLFKFEIFF
jgi:hypothetical protein